MRVRRGITLTEIIVALGIVLFLTACFSPMVGNVIKRNKQKQIVSSVVNSLRIARIYSIEENEPVNFVLLMPPKNSDDEDIVFGAVSKADYDDSESLGISEFEDTVDWKYGYARISISGVWAGLDTELSRLTEEIVAITFFPDGSTGEGQLSFYVELDNGTRLFKIEIEGLTGQIRLVEEK